MIKEIFQLFNLLTPSQISRFYKLQILVIFMAFCELIAIASIAPFMAMVGNIDVLNGDGLLAEIYILSELGKPLDFVFFFGVLLLIILVMTTSISMYTIWKLSFFGVEIGTEISNRLYEYYLKQDWPFHTANSSAYLTKQISSESVRVTDQIIHPLMIMNSKIVLAVFISVGIFLYDPVVAIMGVTLFIFTYYILYRFVKGRLLINGNAISSSLTERFRLMSEGIGGIKDLILLDRKQSFIDRFNSSGKVFSRARAANNSISQIPRYLMELVAFGAIIVLVLFLIKMHNGDLGTILPILGVYALACMKLLPALQQIYASVSQIKGNISAFESIKVDLTKSLNMNSYEKYANKEIHFKNKIIFNKIYFSYPGKSIPAISDMSITINFNCSIGFIGASGSGKSTTIDLLTGMLSPCHGEIIVDDIIIDENNKRSWQNKFGFVSQSIFLCEGSIAENIAFGIPYNDINIKQVERAVQLSNLSGYIESLPNGIWTVVGERGVQISGGQRQRIGIARALYSNAEILVFDEATSALDGITEKYIMDSIESFIGKKTIVIIAHRLKTIKNCDIIYLMDKGRVIDNGTYHELLTKNSKFRAMVEHS